MKQAFELKESLESFFVKNKLIGFFVLTTFFTLIFGIPSALVPNPFIHYVRMIPTTWLDYFFLFATSSLLAINVLVFLDRKTSKVEGKLAGGGLAGFLAIACPTCNVLLVSLLGVGFVLAFIEPMRPLFGVLSIVALSGTIYFQLKQPVCIKCDDYKEK